MTNTKQDTQREKQQSPNWERYKDAEGKINGFPFKEGFPTGGPFGTVNKMYEIITGDGSRYRAIPDYSRQYYAEGIQWRTTEGETLDKFFVAAWRET